MNKLATDNAIKDVDSDSPVERPTSLRLDSNNISVDSNEENRENCENDSLEKEVTSIRTNSSLDNEDDDELLKVRSNVGQNGKFRLRDISPSRLRYRSKDRSKTDDGTKPSTPQRKNVRSTTTSWLPASFQQMFPSYKSKAGDFKRLFKVVPETERLITDYSCALQRDILVHGRLYVSQNWLCFYANIFGWETLVTVHLSDVTCLTKEKTALVIPNAIQVWTEVEKYFFTSFVSRDSTFRSLYRIWQNVMSEEPEQVATLMKAVGKYIDVDSEADNSSRGSNEDLPSDFDEIVVDDIDDESHADSEEPHSNGSGKEASNDGSDTAKKVPDIALSPASPLDLPGKDSPAVLLNGTAPEKKTSGTPESRRKFPFPFKKELSPLAKKKKTKSNKRSSRDKLINGGNRDSLIEEGSLSESNDSDNGCPTLCPCDSHLNIQCINEEYAYDVDTMYEYLFTDCDFYRSMRAARTDYDLDIEPWVEIADEKRRSVKYTINLNLTIGPKTSKIEEKQVLRLSKPGQFYVVESEVINEGIPYSESFVIVQRYCLTRVNSFTCRLRVTATVKYIRQVWGFVKGFITKNSVDGLMSFFNFLKDFIRAAEESALGKRRRKDLSRANRETNEALEDAVVKMTERADKTGEPDIVSSGIIGGKIILLVKNVWRNYWFQSIFIILLLTLLLLNVYLGYRVISLERSTTPWETFGLPSLPSDCPSDVEELRNILYKQQYIQNIQIKRWQQVLSTSIQFLQQVQDSLKELQKEAETPLSG